MPEAASPSNPTEAEPLTFESNSLIVDGLVKAVTNYYQISTNELLASEHDYFVNDARAVLLTTLDSEAGLNIRQLAAMTNRLPQSVRASIDSLRGRAENSGRVKRHLSELAIAASSGEPLATTVETWPVLVQEHYCLSAAEIEAAASDKAREARQVLAYLLLQNTPLRQSVIAKRVGMPNTNIDRLPSLIVGRKTHDPLFAKRLDLLKANQQPGPWPEIIQEAETLGRVADYYYVTVPDLVGPDNRRQFYYPRFMAGYLIKARGGFNDDLDRIFGGQITHSRLRYFETQLKQSYLQTQYHELLLPPVGTPHANGRQLIDKVCSFYGVELTDLVNSNGRDLRMVASRQAIVHLLINHLRLPNWLLTNLFQCHSQEIGNTARQCAKKKAEDNLFAEEINYLIKTSQIDQPIHQKVINLVAAVSRLDVSDIKPVGSPMGEQAFRLVVKLLTDYSHFGQGEVAKLFAIDDKRLVTRANKIIRQQATTTAMSSVLEWIRRQSLTDQTTEFDNRDLYQQLQYEAQRVASDATLAANLMVKTEVRQLVYQITQQVADFYDVSVDDILGRSTDFYAEQARRVAMLLCEKANVRVVDLGLIFDNRPHNVASQIIRRTIRQQKVWPEFNREVLALTEGQPRPDKLVTAATTATKYYNVAKQDLAQNNDYWSLRARGAYLHLVVASRCESLQRAGGVLGWSAQYTRGQWRTARHRWANDQHFKVEIEYLKDPAHQPRPVKISDVINKVSHFFGFNSVDLLQPKNALQRQARQIAAYLLFTEMSLPAPLVADALSCTTNSAWHYINDQRQKLGKSPNLIQQIDQIGPPYFINLQISN